MTGKSLKTTSRTRTLKRQFLRDNPEWMVGIAQNQGGVWAVQVFRHDGTKSGVVSSRVGKAQLYRNAAAWVSSQ